MDDRTGTIFEILNKNHGTESYVVPRLVITEGNGNTDKGMKWEWATIKDNELYVGSMGKEYTTPDADPMSKAHNLLRPPIPSDYPSSTTFIDSFRSNDVTTIRSLDVDSSSKKENAVDDLAGKSDGMGGLKRSCAFNIGYATTSRATCKRCDLRIMHGELRVSSRPLFRGKPGYTIFKHLQCTVFPSDVLCAEDVDGYDDLDMEDYEKLTRRITESVAEIELETKELEPEELVQKDFRGTIRDMPPGLNATLLPFQKEGMSWMYCQEVGISDQEGEGEINVICNKRQPTPRVGLLSDEMGMGKTLQTISLILDHRPLLQHMVPNAKHPPNSTLDHKILVETEEKLWDEALKDWYHEMEMCSISPSIIETLNSSNKSSSNKSSKKKKTTENDCDHNNDEAVINRAGARAGTLVVCPVAALTQWKTEIEKFCEPGTVQVVIYHGPDRERLIPRILLRQYDIVLTTYQVLEADFRKMVSPNRVKCPNCGGKFKIDKLRIHLKYFCGEAAERTEAQARQHRNRDRSLTDLNRFHGPPPVEPVLHEKGKKGFTRNSAKVVKIKIESTQFHEFDRRKATTEKMSKKRPKGNKSSSVVKKLKIERNDNTPNALDPSPRTQRRAAAVAKTRLKVLSKETYDDTGSTDEASDYDGHGFQDDESVSQHAEEEDVLDYESESVSEDENLKQAREAQEKAIQRAKMSGKKTFATSKEVKNLNDKKEIKVSKSANLIRTGMKNSSKVSKKSADDNSEDDSMNMEALLQEAMAGAKISILHSVCWWRIVLDEAHMIKSRSSQTAAAAFSLIGIHRWCLSGTPLQNRVGEFYSLVRFLRIDPMAHYFCRHKDCNCKSIHYRMFEGKCKGCGHGSVEHFSYFNKHILNPIQRDGYSGDGRKAMFTLKTEILDPYVLRRTKSSRSDDLELPPRLVEIRPVRLHPIEEDFYNALYTQTKSSFDDYVREGTLLNNYAHIFDLLIRMRQSVAHPYLVLFSKSDKRSTPGVNAAIKVQDCGICHEPTTHRVISTCCQASFCRGCVDEYMESEINSHVAQCPNCREPFSIDLNRISDDDVIDDCTLKLSANVTQLMDIPSVREMVHVSTGSILHRIDLALFSSSTKIEALTKELVQMRRTSPGSKAIVFSQFVNMLDLIRWRLHSDPFLTEVGLGVRSLHGGMDVKARDSTLKDFREDPHCRVLLMSLKAGGVALNLTVADHIFLMDPWWNPAAENQAIDRTHRLGQYRPIKAVRFIAEDTVEERILQLQEKKRLVFDGTVGRDAASLKMLSVEDMKCLFQ